MTETEREELELAAKAAGLRVVGRRDHGLLIRSEGCKTGYDWNPRDNDGDSFRLMVACDLNVFSVRGAAYAMPSENDGIDESKVCHAGNPLEATRLAIFRAAVDIGRSMP